MTIQYSHLGSSAFITNSNGNVSEHLQYLPFGELFVNQQNSTYDTRYKFSAKELDNETGYNYFGARYYDSDLSVFLSVDNFSDKYPYLTPYHYCANNPLNLIDINGDSLKLHNARTDGGDSRSDFTNHLAERTGWNLTMKGDKVDFASKKDFKKARKEMKKSDNVFKQLLFDAITSDDDRYLDITSDAGNVDVSNRNKVDFADLQIATESGFDLARIGASLYNLKYPDIEFKDGAGVIERKILMEENMTFRKSSVPFSARGKWEHNVLPEDNKYIYRWENEYNDYIFTITLSKKSGSITKISYSFFQK